VVGSTRSWSTRGGGEGLTFVADLVDAGSLLAPHVLLAHTPAPAPSRRSLPRETGERGVRGVGSGVDVDESIQGGVGWGKQ
jgi:hypothetical protein